MIVTQSVFRKFIKSECENCFGNTSYKLRIGKQYIDREGGEKPINKDIGDTILIKSNSGILVSTLEVIELDNEHIAHFDLKIDYAANKGLFFQAGPQVKPGYHGILWGYLFNISDIDIPLIVGYDAIFDIEFIRISEPVEVEFHPPIKSLSDAKKAGLLRQIPGKTGIAKAIEKSNNALPSKDFYSNLNMYIGGAMILFAALFASISYFSVKFQSRLEEKGYNLKLKYDRELIHQIDSVLCGNDNALHIDGFYNIDQRSFFKLKCSNNTYFVEYKVIEDLYPIPKTENSEE